MRKSANGEQYHIKKRLPTAIKIRDYLITVLMWVLWLYIMFPLIAVLVWKSTGLNIYEPLSLDIDPAILYEKSLEFLVYGAMIVGATSIFIVVWGGYNRIRFAGERNRRKKSPPRIDCERMAESLKVDSGFIRRFQNARYIQVYHTDRVMNDDVFKPFDNEDIESVSLFFCNDWDRVRAESKFGYSHGV